MKGLPAPVTPLPDPFKGGTLIFKHLHFPKESPEAGLAPAPLLPIYPILGLILRLRVLDAKP